MRFMKRLWLWLAVGTVSMLFGCGREPFEPLPEPMYGVEPPPDIQPAPAPEPQPMPQPMYGVVFDPDMCAEYGVVFEPQDVDYNMEPVTDEPVDGIEVLEPESE